MQMWFLLAATCIGVEKSLVNSAVVNCEMQKKKQ